MGDGTEQIEAMTGLSGGVCVALVVASLAAVAGCGGRASDVHDAVATGTSSVVPSSSTPLSSTPPSSTPSSTPASSSASRGAPSTASLSAPTVADLRSARSVPVEDPYYPDTSNPEVDALHYALDLAWDGTTLIGDTTLIFRAATATDRVRLDLSSALVASEVRLDGHDIGYDQSGDGIVMSTGPLITGSTHTLEISYSGRPRSTPAPSTRSDMTEGLGWNVDSDGSVYTFQEPYGAFTWYPVNDHPSDKALYDATISTRGGDVAVFNGDLLSSDRRGGDTTTSWHLGAPAASYLITLAIGPYTRSVVTTAGGMEIAYWVLPQDSGLLPGLERQGAKAFDWLRAHAGSYPFSTLGVVVVGGDSAMETQTLITMSRSAVARSDAVLEHEMAHQWYGDSVTPSDWQGLWLSEGWAMYMQQWYERDSGRPVFAGGIRRWRGLDQQSRRRSGPPGHYDPETFGDLNVYLGPAMMLDAIRRRLGNASFDAMARRWPAQHPTSTVDRDTFARWLRRDTGIDLRPLIHRWLDSARTPAIPRR